jgi:hypothetical protein
MIYLPSAWKTDSDTTPIENRRNPPCAGARMTCGCGVAYPRKRPGES